MNDLVATVATAMQAQAARNRGFLSDAMARALASVAIDIIRQSGSGASPVSLPRLETADGIWEATGELRWHAEQIDRPAHLQQAWRHVVDGHVRWRPVPLVVERQTTG
jgi:hypothetical protein